ncbi:hypothetical protein L5515_018676 [Caenorhabditis briggsae]|uniref:Uncharacterized protein n=1 Tax=Caenorhabditis briggsae TaxID=6238 RepID=A0AAE9JSL2_CAEBR|nr:hypothetical protein L5515_018676 [Caenorhabditis briggsae]
MSDESNDDPNRHISSADKKCSRESNTSGAGSHQTKSSSTTAWNTNAPVFTPQGIDRSGEQVLPSAGPGYHGPMHQSYVDPNYHHHPNYPYGHHPHGMMPPGHQHQQVPPRFQGVPPQPQYIPFDPERHCSNIHPSWYGMRNGQKVFLGPTQRIFQAHGPPQNSSHQNNPHQSRTQNEANNQHSPNGPPISKTHNKDNRMSQSQQQPNNHPTPSMSTNAVSSEAQGNNTKQPVSYSIYQNQPPQPIHVPSGANKPAQQQHGKDNFQGGHQHPMSSFGAQYSSDVRRSHPHMQNNYQEKGYGQQPIHPGSNASRNNSSCNLPVQYYQETHHSSYQSQKAAGDFHQDNNQNPLASGGGNFQHSGNKHFVQNNTQHQSQNHQLPRVGSCEPILYNSGRPDGYSDHNNLQHNQNQQSDLYYTQNIGSQVQQHMALSKNLLSEPPIREQHPSNQVHLSSGSPHVPLVNQSKPPLLPDPPIRLVKSPLVPNPFYIGPPHVIPQYIDSQSVPSSSPNMLQHRTMHHSSLPIPAECDRRDIMNNNINFPMQQPRKEIVPVFHAIHAMGQYIQSLHVINAQHAQANSYLNAQLKEYVDRETQLLHTLESISKLSSIVEETEQQLSSPTELLTPKSLNSPRSGNEKSSVEGLPNTLMASQISEQDASESNNPAKLEKEETKTVLKDSKDEIDSIASLLQTIKLDQPDEQPPAISTTCALAQNADERADKSEHYFPKVEQKTTSSRDEVEKAIDFPPTETKLVAAQPITPTAKNNNSTGQKPQKQRYDESSSSKVSSKPVERRSDMKPYLPPASRGKTDQPNAHKSQKQKTLISTNTGSAKPIANKKSTQKSAVVSTLNDASPPISQLGSHSSKKTIGSVENDPAKDTTDRKIAERRHAPLSPSLSLPAQSAYKSPLVTRSRSSEFNKLISLRNKSEETKNKSNSQTPNAKTIVSSPTPPAGNYKKTCKTSQRSNEKPADVLSNQASNVSQSQEAEEKPPVITRIIVPTAKEAVDLPLANHNAENISKKAKMSSKANKSKPKKRFSKKQFLSKNSQQKTSLEDEKEQMKELKKLELLQKAEKKERLQCLTTVRKFTKSYYNDMHRARCTYLAFWKPRPLMPEIQSEIIHFWGDRMPGAFSHSEKLEELVLTFVNNRIRRYKGSANMDIYKIHAFVIMDDFLWQIDKKLSEYNQLELDRHYYEMVSTFPEWKPRNVPSDCCKYEDFLQPPVIINEHPLRCFIAHLNLQNCMINNLHFDPDLITDLDDHVGQMFDELTDVPVDWTPTKTKVFFRAKIAVLTAKKNKTLLERDFLQFYNFLLHVKSHVLDFDVFWYHLSCTTKKREGEEWLLTNDLMFFRLLFGDEDKWHR